MVGLSQASEPDLFTFGLPAWSFHSQKQQRCSCCSVTTRKRETKCYECSSTPGKHCNHHTINTRAAQSDLAQVRAVNLLEHPVSDRHVTYQFYGSLPHHGFGENPYSYISCGHGSAQTVRGEPDVNLLGGGRANYMLAMLNMKPINKAMY